MRNLLIATVMLLGFWALYVAFHTPPAVANGAELRRNCGHANIWNDLACRSYVNGLVEGMAVAIHPAICFPASFDKDKALALVRRYLHSHDVSLEWDSPRIVQAAMRDAFPCHFPPLEKNSPQSDSAGSDAVPARPDGVDI